MAFSSPRGGWEGAFVIVEKYFKLFNPLNPFNYGQAKSTY